MVIAPQFFKAANFAEGLALVRADANHSMQGFIDSSGEFVIGPGPPVGYQLPRRYREQWTYGNFHDGRALFRLGDAISPCGYIGADGRVAIPTRFIRAEDFSEGLACVRLFPPGPPIGHMPAGFIDRDGVFAIPPSGNYVALGFAEGMCHIGVQQRISAENRRDEYQWNWGYMNVHGDIAIPLCFDRAWPFSGGLACVRGEHEGRTVHGFINRRGDTVVPLIYDQVSPRFGDRLICATRGKQAFLLDDAGQIVHEVSLDATSMYPDSFCCGRAAFSVDCGGVRKHGYLGTSGEVVIPPIFDWAKDFRGGLAEVTLGQTQGYIDVTGRFVWQATTSKSENGDV